MVSFVRCSVVLTALLGFFNFNPRLDAQALEAPTCNSFIEGEIALHNGNVAQFRVHAGGLFTASEDGEGYRYGVLPLLNKSHGYELVPFQISTSGPNIIIDLLGAAPAMDSNSTKELSLKVGSFQVQIRRTSWCKNDVPWILQKGLGSPDSSNFSVCCASCDGDTVCGGSVVTSCGTSCNTGGGFRVL